MLRVGQVYGRADECAGLHGKTGTDDVIQDLNRESEFIESMESKATEETNNYAGSGVKGGHNTNDFNLCTTEKLIIRA